MDRFALCSAASLVLVHSSFFFQAEDGIRDHCVTGVQTCALPIYSARQPRRPAARSCRKKSLGVRPMSSSGVARNRSEERRVGKECRDCWSAEQDENKNVLACSSLSGDELESTNPADVSVAAAPQP